MGGLKGYGHVGYYSSACLSRLKKTYPTFQMGRYNKQQNSVKNKWKMYSWHSLLFFKNSYLHMDTINILQAKNILPCTARHLRVEVKMIFHNICNCLCICCWPWSTTIDVIRNFCQFIRNSVWHVGSRCSTRISTKHNTITVFNCHNRSLKGE